jgi:tRNA pseudouridine55 synthase
LERIFARFTGEIQQVPPMYSAVKIHGRKLCDLARKGEQVERAPRTVTIFRLELLEQTGEREWLFRCLCSKGTYVRTLCHDIGAALGCGGCMSSLRRTMAAGFSLDRAVTLDCLQERGESLLTPLDVFFAEYPAYTVPSAGAEERCRHGNPLTDTDLRDGTYRVYGREGDFLCLSSAQDGVLRAVKNFFRT